MCSYLLSAEELEILIIDLTILYLHSDNKNTEESSLFSKRLSSLTPLFIYKSPSHDSGLPDMRGEEIGGGSK